MGIVVQKYGGSSLSDADAVKRVALRIVQAKKQGHDVVVAVSAMGDSTDELLDLAKQLEASKISAINATARLASSTSSRPLMMSLPGHRLLTHSTSFQDSAGSN